MSRWFGAIVGTIIGGITGGFGGAVKGFQVGYTIGAAFEDTELEPGPRMEDLSQNISRYGEGIPRVYGRELVTGNVIWMKNNALDEVAKEVVVQEGLFSDVTQLRYFYYASFAVALSEGEIDGVSKIWANNELIYKDGVGLGELDRSLFNIENPAAQDSKEAVTDSQSLENLVKRLRVSNLNNLTIDGVNVGEALVNRPSVRIYKGTLDQDVDPLIAANEGASAPAFRGTAYIVFENLLLTNESYKNSIPDLKFEIVRNSTDLEYNPTGKLGSFSAGYTVELGNGTLSASKNNRILPKYESEGSILLGADGITQSSTFQFRAGTAYSLSYANKGNYLYSMVHLDGGSTYNPEYRPNYEVTLQSGTKVNYFNTEIPLYVHQIHDMSRLEIPVGGGGASFKDRASMVYENVAKLYPFDFVGSYVPDDKPFVKPIQNLPNWVVVPKGFKMFIGYMAEGRFVLWDLGINLDEPYQEGLIDKRGYVERGTKMISGLHASFINGYVYIYMSANSIQNQTYDAFMPGVIRVDVSDLEAFPVEFTNFPPGSVEIGINSVIESTTDTIKINFFDGIERRVPYSQVVWNKEVIFSHLGYDYENKKLYGVLDNSNTFTIDSNGFIDTSHTSGSAISNQKQFSVYPIDLNTLEVGASIGVINDSSVSGTYDTKTSIGLLRVYNESILDYGVYQAPVAESQGTSYLVPSNSETYYNYNFTYGNNNHITISDDLATMPMSVNNLNSTSNEIMLIPLPSKGDASTLQNIFMTSQARYTTSSASVRTVGLSAISRQVVTLEGVIDDLFNQTPFIEVGELISAELLRTGVVDLTNDTDLTSLDTVISGISIKDRSPIKNTLKALQEAYLFDIVDVDYKISGDLRENKSVVRTIPIEELGANESSKIGTSKAFPDFKLTTPRRGQLPAFYNFTYRDRVNVYEPTTLTWQDTTVNNNVTLDVKLPMVLSQEDAYNLVRKVALVTIASRRGVIEIQTSFKHSDLELSDFIKIEDPDGNEYTARIINIDKGRPGLVKISAIVDSPSIYTYEAGNFTSEVVDSVIKGELVKPIIIDSLPFQESQDGVGWWVGGYQPDLTRIVTTALSIVNESSTQLRAPVTVPNTAAIGFTTTALGSTINPGIFDYTETLTFIPAGFNDFVDSTEADVLQDELTNTFWYGSGNYWELIKIVNFTTNADGSITGSGILRGYKGTAHLRDHTAGDWLVNAGNGSFTRALVPTSSVGDRARIIPSNTAELPNLQIFTEIEYGSRLPLPPINVSGHKRDNGDFIINWTRQTRYGIEWVNTYDAQLDEDIEEYRVYILDSGTNTVLDVQIVTDDNELLYNVSNQTTTFGSEQSNITLVVAQYSNELQRAGFLSEITEI